MGHCPNTHELGDTYIGLCNMYIMDLLILKHFESKTDQERHSYPNNVDPAD